MTAPASPLTPVPAASASARRRILHITRNLPPLVGGMERLNWHIADELSRQAEVKVIGPKGSHAIKPSTRLLNQKLGTSPVPRMLTPSEIGLLRQSKREIAQRARATATRQQP